MQTWEVETLAELEPIVEAVVSACKGDTGSGAVVLALSGDLGAGKTTFTQHLAKQLGVSEPVTSPTFVIQKQYETTDAELRTLVHIDAYRIESLDELRPLHFTELLQQRGTLVVIEWAERISPALPSTCRQLTLDIVGSKRVITFYHG